MLFLLRINSIKTANKQKKNNNTNTILHYNRQGTVAASAELNVCLGPTPQVWQSSDHNGPKQHHLETEHTHIIQGDSMCYISIVPKLQITVKYR